jgi:hypothetical protein
MYTSDLVQIISQKNMRRSINQSLTQKSQRLERVIDVGGQGIIRLTAMRELTSMDMN